MAKRACGPDDIYLLRLVTDPHVSPDGRRLAYVVSTHDRDTDKLQTALWVAERPAAGRRRSHPVGPARPFTTGPADHSPRWSPDGRYLAFVSQRADTAQLYLSALDGGEPRKLTDRPHGVSQPAWSPDGRLLAFVARVGKGPPSQDASPIEKAAPRQIRHLRNRLDGIGWLDDRRQHLFVVDIENGEQRQITDGDWDDEQPAWSPDGGRLAFVSNREPARHDMLWRSDLWVLDLARLKARPKKLTASRGACAFPAFSPDGASVAYLGHEAGDAGFARDARVFLVAAGGSSRPRAVTESLDRPAVGLLRTEGTTLAWLPSGAALLVVMADRGTQAVHRFGVDGRHLGPVVAGDRRVGAIAVGADGRRLAFTANWVDQPWELYDVALPNRGQARFPVELSHANDELRATVALATAQRQHSRGPGQAGVESFVTRPPAGPAQRVNGTRRRSPAVLDIHGGPHGSHPGVASVRGWISTQVFAGAGYTVIQPNPRGSTGYGQAFTEACVGDWAGADYEDLLAALDSLVAGGQVDQERLYVWGYSYGGYLTAWAVGHTGRFRAAVVGAPVTDLFSMTGTTDVPAFNLFELGGAPWERPEEYLKRSPTTYLPDVETPVLLVHWEGDLRCPIGQADEVFTMLKLLGKEVELVRYPGGFHVTASPWQSADVCRRMVAWFDRHGGPAGR